MKIINIQGQFMEHSNARIVGNREGLKELLNLIANAIANGKSVSKVDENKCLMASDGEGFELTIERNDDEWGLSDLDPKSKTNFWNQKENYPHYIYKEVDEAIEEYRKSKTVMR